ncbi:uncharacterized protein LOC117207076 isoform X2 [Bombus bifarius]|uniref:Uncharacterized protein LOC117207076 isoform X2 n=1 Tax=Bombus bifarius TaxID=103933 RepID=A0A6P8LQ60_9HYME|nr:uncharacterized protein LOC117161007 isoform X2 [Bombus vancouverensis nearcticus]XP_033302816.1 uncharacterized protein LOC117207076 isoform X2 [Bombus bifarius]
MSERQDSTCQKYELPKSLQGTEDAEFVWNMITERFPNAAPLLCEMETVIDRAEDLLQQLRAPCREIETSTSFFTQDSEDSTVMFSARGSVITENDTIEESDAISKNVAEIQVSESSIDEREVNLIDETQNLVTKEQDIGNKSSDSLMMNSSTTQKFSSDESASLNVETNTTKLMKETCSLEEWGKIADAAMRQDAAEVQSVKKTINMFEKRANFEETKMESHSIKKHEDSCITLHRQETCADVGDSVMEIGSHRTASQKFIVDKDDAINLSIQGSGDDSSSKIVSQRTPLNILEAYAKRCKIPVEYEYTSDCSHRHKSNVYVIRGNFAGFAATSRGLTEESTKNDLAAKILQMIANQEMKDEKLGALVDLTQEELLEIINLGADGLRETAQRKLYQLCLKKGVPVPKYCVEKMKTYQGLTYVATCSALGYISEGRGVRECVAKKTAADELYHQYCEDQKAESKINEE